MTHITAGNVLIVSYDGAIDQPTFWEHYDAVRTLPFVEHADADFVEGEMWVYVDRLTRWTSEQIAAVAAIVEGVTA